MNALPQTRFWTGPRLFALGAVSIIALTFIGANVHMIFVAFTSNPDCVLQHQSEGTAVLRAAKPSC